MVKDRRYRTARHMHNKGYVKTFQDLFEFVPKTIVARDIGWNNQRFTKAIESPDDFHIRVAIRMANLFEMDNLEFIALLLHSAEHPHHPLKI